MAKKPGKLGIKLWMAVGVETKYVFNGCPYIGKDESKRANETRVM